jgi:hypothetical protein
MNPLQLLLTLQRLTFPRMYCTVTTMRAIAMRRVRQIEIHKPTPTGVRILRHWNLKFTQGLDCIET